MLINRRIIVSLILILLIGKNLGTGSERRHKKVDSLLLAEEERKEIEKDQSLDSIGESPLQERQIAKSVLMKRQMAPSLLQQGQQRQLTQSLLEHGKKAKAPSLLQHKKLAPSLLQHGKLAPSLLSPTEDKKQPNTYKRTSAPLKQRPQPKHVRFDPTIEQPGDAKLYAKSPYPR